MKRLLGIFPVRCLDGAIWFGTWGALDWMLGKTTNLLSASLFLICLALVAGIAYAAAYRPKVSP